MNLPIARKEQRFIQTFEDKNGEPRILNVVQAKIKSVHNLKFVNIEHSLLPGRYVRRSQIKRLELLDLHKNIS